MILKILRFLKYLQKLQNSIDDPEEAPLPELRDEDDVWGEVQEEREREAERKKQEGRNKKPLRINLKKEVRREKKKVKMKKERPQKLWLPDFAFPFNQKGSMMCCGASLTCTCACEVTGTQSPKYIQIEEVNSLKKRLTDGALQDQFSTPLQLEISRNPMDVPKCPFNG